MISGGASAQVTADYSQPYFTSKASMIIAKNPLINLAAATGYNGWVLGASAVVDPRGSNLSAVEGAASYVGPDFVATAHTTPAFKRIRGTYWQQLDASSSVAAEVVHAPDDKKVDLHMAYCHFDVVNGARVLPPALGAAGRSTRNCAPAPMFPADNALTSAGDRC